MTNEKSKKFQQLVDTYHETDKLSDKIKMHTYAINECKMYMNDPMTEEYLLKQVVKVEEELTEALELLSIYSTKMAWKYDTDKSRLLKALKTLKRQKI